MFSETLELQKMLGLQKKNSNTFVTHDEMNRFNNKSFSMYDGMEHGKFMFYNEQGENIFMNLIKKLMSLLLMITVYILN